MTSYQFVSSEYTTHYIPSQKSNVKFHIILPGSLDSTFSWRWFQDCSRCCDKYFHRIANSTYSIIQENGTMSPKAPDSLYQFTLKYFVQDECSKGFKTDLNSLDSIALALEQIHKESYVENVFFNWEVKEVIEVNNQQYLVLAYSQIFTGDGFKGLRNNIIRCYTTHRNELYLFEFEYYGYMEDRFFEDMLQSINSIKILYR